MKESLLPLLSCPITGETLQLKAGETVDGEVLGGTLMAAGHRYPIMNGVPCLLEPEQQVAAKEGGFTDMWRYRRQGEFEKKSLYGIQPAKKADWVEAKFSRPFGEGEWVLDLGCGSAELTFELAGRNPQTQVVGFDFSEEVRMRGKAAREHANLHFVQGDALRSPFRPGSFDKIFSLGVLHHTRDTREAFEKAAALLKPGGELVTWIYPDPKESALAAQLYFVRDVGFLGKGHEIPPDLRLRLTRLYALSMMPAMTVAYTGYKLLSSFLPGKDKVLDEDLSITDLFHTTAFSVYDTITPQYQFRHKKREVLGWYESLGFVDSQTDGHGTYWGRRAEDAA